MKIGLLIPCYVDLFYPEVGVATLELLEKLKVDVVYPFDQTCCGQPMANSGCYEEAQATEELFIKNFAAFDHIVTPSGSCTHHLRNKFTAAPDSPERRKISASVYDLVEFLHDVLKVREFPGTEFKHRVALHTSCSAIRGIGLASMSERVHDPKFSNRNNCWSACPVLSSSISKGRTNAAALADRSPSRRRQWLPKWDTTKSNSCVKLAPAISSLRTCPASCICKAAQVG